MYGCQSYSWLTEQFFFFFQTPIASQNLVSRDGSFPKLKLKMVITPGISPAFSEHILHVFCTSLLGQSRVYLVNLLCTDGYCCRDPGPVVLNNVVRVTGTAFSEVSPWTNYYAPLFYHTHY